MSPEVEPVVPPDKRTLRLHLRAQRRSLAPQRNRSADAAAIAVAASTLLDRLERSPAQAGENPAEDERPCVAIYRSLPTEPPTRALAEMLHERNVTVLVPETLQDFDLEWHELRADGSEGPPLGLGGIFAADLILTPALSVDRTGTRLGQGGGCYDRALTRRRPDAAIVAIVNDQELAFSPLPCNPHDVPVDAVITPGGGYCQITQTASAT